MFPNAKKPAEQTREAGYSECAMEGLAVRPRKGDAGGWAGAVCVGCVGERMELCVWGVLPSSTGSRTALELPRWLAGCSAVVAQSCSGACAPTARWTRAPCTAAAPW